MSEEQTCGKGLAAHATLPRHLAAVAAAMAELLEHHRTSLDVADADAQAEDDAYETLATEFRGTAASLNATAARMAGYRDLTMAPHDFTVLGTPEAMQVLQHLVDAEEELLRLLQTTTGQYREMLASMQ